jgi:hypothetical protein
MVFKVSVAVASLIALASCAPRNGPNGWRKASRCGRCIASPADLEAYRKASLLPKQILHPRTADEVFFSFVRGEYDVAVFQAFRIVETANGTSAPGLRPQSNCFY